MSGRRGRGEGSFRNGRMEDGESQFQWARGRMVNENDGTFTPRQKLRLKRNCGRYKRLTMPLSSTISIVVESGVVSDVMDSVKNSPSISVSVGPNTTSR